MVPLRVLCAAAGAVTSRVWLRPWRRRPARPPNAAAPAAALPSCHPAGVFQDNVYCHLASGLGAGFFAVCVGSPVDVVKSRMMGALCSVLPARVGYCL